MLGDKFGYYLAIFWSFVTVAYIFAITFFEVVNPKAADTILGFLMGTIVATIINFYFGSSKGSKDKTKLLKTKEDENKIPNYDDGIGSNTTDT